MDIKRIPAEGEKPFLYCAISTDHEEVNWVLQSDGEFDKRYGDYNWWQVTANNPRTRSVTFEAMCWYHCAGECSITISDLSPNEAALAISKAADLLSGM